MVNAGFRKAGAVFVRCRALAVENMEGVWLGEGGGSLCGLLLVRPNALCGPKVPDLGSPKALLFCPLWAV